MAGSIGWIDLTVPNADRVREFYQNVTGWVSSPVDMGGYHDFCMHPSAGKGAVAGICHARGANAELPAQWIIYITVDDIEESVRRCEALGGRLRVPVRSMGPGGRFCVIEDPAGAVAALFEPVHLKVA
jgi:predicted enzyme related to lactoylglutathione lyase